MITLTKVVPSHIPSKKYDAHFVVDGRTRVVPFGAAGYEDYTQTRDGEQRERYRTRHKHDNLNDPTSAGSLSWWILWTEPTVRKGILAYRRHFGL
jgi:hypothetical protein